MWEGFDFIKNTYRPCACVCFQRSIVLCPFFLYNFQNISAYISKVSVKNAKNGNSAFFYSTSNLPIMRERIKKLRTTTDVL